MPPNAYATHYYTNFSPAASPGWHTEWKEVPGIGSIPADWEVVRLGDAAEVQTGRAVNRNATRNGNLQVSLSQRGKCQGWSS